MDKDRWSDNYYDILNVHSKCSDKEIKTAYAQLSKKFHPDVKSIRTDAEQTARFLKIVEAYQTLSKPKLRFEYDKSLQEGQSMKIYGASSYRKTEIYRPWEIKPEYDPNPGPYYGIKHLNKTSNFKVALVLLALGIIGGIFGYASAKQAFALNQNRMNDVSNRASEHHQKVRLEVEKYSKDEQLRKVIERIRSQAKK